MLLKEEGLEVYHQLQSVACLSTNSCVFDNPVIIKEAKLFLEEFSDLLISRMLLELLNKVFDVTLWVVRFSKSKNWSCISKILGVRIFLLLTFTIFKFTINVLKVEPVDVQSCFWFAEACDQRVTSNDSPVVLDNIVQGN